MIGRRLRSISRTSTASTSGRARSSPASSPTSSSRTRRSRRRPTSSNTRRRSSTRCRSARERDARLQQEAGRAGGLLQLQRPRGAPPSASSPTPAPAATTPAPTPTATPPAPTVPAQASRHRVASPPIDHAKKDDTAPAAVWLLAILGGLMLLSAVFAGLAWWFGWSAERFTRPWKASWGDFSGRLADAGSSSATGCGRGSRASPRNFHNI